MKIDIDYLIVGSGLTGATIARLLKDAGCEVLVLERRAWLGGNIHDYVHPSGINIHTYGPHYFRTGSEKIWSFVNRFTDFYKFEAVIKSFVDDQYENWPVAASYIRRVFGDHWEPEFSRIPTNFEEASLAMMPRMIYEKFVKGYTEKQWGISADELSADLAKRFDVREDDEPRLFRHKYQGIPVNGYSSFMCNLLTGISLMLNVDYLKFRDRFNVNKRLIFTGPIDEFFDCDLGRLSYRGQTRKHVYLPDVDYVQPCGQVNNPDIANGSHIRTLEWKHMLPLEFANKISGTVLTTETTITPIDFDSFEYPFPDKKNSNLYHRYRDRAEAIRNLLVCGRLGEYRYYDMDQAIGRAMVLADKILADS
jgi:UDP-galactopyranose mutase